MAPPAVTVGFSTLPAEMTEMILLNLSQTEQRQVRGVCRKWRDIVEKKLVVEKLTLTDMTLDTFRAFNPDILIQELVVKSFLSPLKIKSRTRSRLQKNIRCITIGTGAGFPGNMGYFDFKDKGLDLQNIKALLLANSGIEELMISASGSTLCFNGNSPIPQSLDGLHLEWLTTLDICFGNPFNSNPLVEALDPFVKLLQNHFPSMHTLNYACISRTASIKQWVAVLQCIADHRRSIRILKIAHPTLYLTNEALEQGPWYTADKYNELRHNLLLVNLDFIFLESSNILSPSGQRWRILESEFVHGQPAKSSSMILFSSTYCLHIKWQGLIQQPFDCSVLNVGSRLDSLILEVQANERQEFLSFDQYYLNIQALPTDLGKIWFGLLIPDTDAFWISDHMTGLQEVTYANLHSDETGRVLDHFLAYLRIPTFTHFRITNYLCPRIERLALDTPGLTIENSVIRTDVTVNRHVFEPVQFNLALVHAAP